jgi:hypothetical protein
MQVPDFLNAKIGGLPAVNVIRDDKQVGWPLPGSA